MIYVNTETQGQFIEILKILEKKGWTWASGAAPLFYSNAWRFYKDKTFLNYSDLFVTNTKRSITESDKNAVIYEYDDFIKYYESLPTQVAETVLNKIEEEFPFMKTTTIEEDVAEGSIPLTEIKVEGSEIIDLDGLIINLDPFYYHEALDRTYMIQNMVDTFLCEHPVYLKHDYLMRRISVVSDELTTLYQEISNLKHETPKS